MTPDRLLLPGLERSLRLYLFADLHLQAGAHTDHQVPASWRQTPSPSLPLDNGDLLRSHLDRAREGNADAIIACGDLCHFPSRENADLIAPMLHDSPIPVCSVPGNHDWFYPGQDGWEDLRDTQLPRLSGLFGDSPWCWRRDLHGLRLIGLENSTYFLSDTQARFLEREIQSDAPVLVVMHIPLSTPALREATIAKHGHPILMSDPAGRTREGIDPDPTRRVTHLLRTHPAIHGVLAAHVHLPFREDISPGRPQLIPEAGYRHGYRWIDCKPR